MNEQDKEKTVNATVTSRPQRPSEPTDAQRLAAHPMHSPSDLAYFRGKGYSDAEILAFWDRDHAAGGKPLRHETTEKRLADVLAEAVGPHAVAAMSRVVQAIRTGDVGVDGEVQWFAEQMMEAVGGPEARDRLLAELDGWITWAMPNGTTATDQRA